jgi:hypothetical protein
VLPLLALAMYLAYKNVRGVSELRYAYIPGALSRHYTWLFNVIPLTAGLMGASLADERRKGIALTILARGVSRGQYLLSKMLGAAASGALLTLFAIGVFYAIVAIVWLPERATWTKILSITYAHYAFPVQNLVVHDILAALMLVSAAAALCLIGVLAGLLVANEYVAMASPPIFTILAIILMGDISEALNPKHYLYLSYPHYVPPGLVFFAPFLYWGGMALLIAMLGKWIIAKQELA